MLVRVLLLILLQLWILSIISLTTGSFVRKRRTFTATKDGFQLDRKKFHIYAGEVHYFRIASCAWKDRLRKLQKSGLNTVSTAIEWALHEPQPEQFYWNENANFIEFINLAERMNLFVIIRAGPFIDADRDLGGLPKWLFGKNLPKNEYLIRGYSHIYRHYAERWLHVLLPKFASRTIANGGPIIMFQIESDLGDGPVCSQNEWLYEIFSHHLGKDTVLFTMNQNFYHNIFCGHINGTIPAIRTNSLEYTVSFNSSVEDLFTPLLETFPYTPKLVELRTGAAWFWGGNRFSYDSQEFEKTLTDILSYDSSFILYMFAGGTNFERAGCSESNANGMITSYDYDAPVSESGDLAERYFRMKSILSKRALNFVRAHGDLTELKGRSRALYSDLNFTCLGSLLDQSVRRDLELLPVQSPEPLVFHEITDSPAEMVLYETVIPRNLSANRRTVDIHSLGIRDRGYVYIGRMLVGIMNHTRHTITTNNPVIPGQSIQILVENQGHRMHSIFGDRKGILSNVYLDDVPLKNWTMFALSFDNVKGLQNRAKRMKRRGLKKHGNCLYRASFRLTPNYSEPMDSILDVSLLGKGWVFINEFSLGRYWSTIGPQQYLYVPGCFIKPYPLINQMLVVELYRRPKKRNSESLSKKFKKKNVANSAVTSNNGLPFFLLLLFSNIYIFLT